MLGMGDDEFLDLLDHALNPLGDRNLIRLIRSGRLYVPAFIIHGAVHAEVLRRLWKNLQFSDERTELEDRIARQAGLPSGGHVIVSIFPEAMQGKTPNTLVEWEDGDLVPLNLLGQTTAIVRDMTALSEMYTHLRKLTVLVSPEFACRVDDIAKICRKEFAGGLELQQAAS